MITRLEGIGVTIICVFWVSGTGKCRDFSVATVTTPTTEIKVALASSRIEQARGLGGCKSLPKKSGMYFPFDSKQTPSFWMKGMLMPIDMVWIADGHVVKVDAYVPAPKGQLDQELIHYPAPQPVDAVLEVEAGQAQQYGLQVKAKAEFKKK
jgi:uncharacterized membrane protein (UPF0127 family)